MKKILFYFLFFCATLQTNAQGFSKAYTLGYRYLEFYHCILEHDTLTMYGMVITKDSIPKFGVYLSKFDTLGNLISTHTHFQADGEIIYYAPQPSFIKTSDNGYAGFLSLGENTEGIIKFKHDGEVAFSRKIIDNQPNINFLKFQEMIEVEDGFIITGINDQIGLPSAVVVYKFDKQFDKILWRKTFSDTKWCLYVYAKSLKVKDKKISFIVEKSDWCWSPDDEAKWTAIEYTLDSLGNKIKEVLIPSYSKIAIYGKIDVNDSEKLYFGEKLLGVIGSNYYRKTNIIKVDSENNEIWNKVISDTSWGTSIKVGFLSKNNDFLLVGNRSSSAPILGTKYITNDDEGGVIYRYDQAGNLKWKKVDTIFSAYYQNKWFPGTPKFYIYRSFYDAVELPSGSIIACGFSDRYDYDVKKDSIRDFHTEAWLYKVDKNGCLNPKDCKTTVSTKEENNLQKIEENVQIFPNPTNDLVNIVVAENQQLDNIEIYDISSKRLKYFSFQNNETKALISLPENASNLYFVKVKTKSGVVSVKKVMKMR